MRQAVDRSLVHKNSADQVMLLTAELGEDGSMRLGIGLPTTHPSADMLPSCSTLLGVELMRQCAIAFAHLGVLGHQVGDRRLVGGLPPSAVWRRTVL